MKTRCRESALEIISCCGGNRVGLSSVELLTVVQPPSLSLSLRKQLAASPFGKYECATGAIAAAMEETPSQCQHGGPPSTSLHQPPGRIKGPRPPAGPCEPAWRPGGLRVLVVVTIHPPDVTTQRHTEMARWRSTPPNVSRPNATRVTRPHICATPEQRSYGAG
jgi:hypothetical protein